MLFTVTPPAVVNWPPTYILVLSVVSALTDPLAPLPRADQLLPFHMAMLFAGTPPAAVNEPPTYTSPLLLIAIAKMTLFVPGGTNLSSQFSSPGTRGDWTWYEVEPDGAKRGSLPCSFTICQPF